MVSKLPQLHECCQLTRCTGTDTLCIVALLEETVDTTDGELETSLRRTRLRLGGGITGGLARLGLAAALARHVERWFGFGSSGCG